jgi:predicted nucleotidyltransferase
MAQSRLAENEKQALEELKKSIGERYRLVDFRVYGSKARGDASPDSDIDVMMELEEYTPAIESAVDDIVYEINLAHDCFISTVIFGRKELEEGPMTESPLYKAIEREGIRV